MTKAEKKKQIKQVQEFIEKEHKRLFDAKMMAMHRGEGEPIFSIKIYVAGESSKQMNITEGGFFALTELLKEDAVTQANVDEVKDIFNKKRVFSR